MRIAQCYGEIGQEGIVCVGIVRVGSADVFVDAVIVRDGRAGDQNFFDTPISQEAEKPRSRTQQATRPAVAELYSFVDIGMLAVPPFLANSCTSPPFNFTRWRYLVSESRTVIEVGSIDGSMARWLDGSARIEKAGRLRMRTRSIIREMQRGDGVRAGGKWKRRRHERSHARGGRKNSEFAPEP